MVLTESPVFQFLTSDFFVGLVKPAIIIGIVGFLFYLELKPKLKNSDMVEV